MDPAAYVLQEIAGQDGDGGAEVGALRTLVEQRQGIMLDDTQLDTALRLLQDKSLVVRYAERYVLSPSIRPRLATDLDGKVTMSRQAWVRLCGSLGLAGS
jgi:hypothetical protein